LHPPFLLGSAYGITARLGDAVGLLSLGAVTLYLVQRGQ
jgi:hypothetical protein